MGLPLSSSGSTQPRRVRRLVWFAGVNLLVLLALYLLAEYVAERTWLTTLLAYAPPLLYTPVTAVLLLLALLRRNRAALIFTLVAALLLTGPVLGLLHFSRVTSTSGAPHVRLMTWNIAHGVGGTERIRAVIENQKPDVLCLQEVNGMKGIPDPLPALEKACPSYHFVRAGEVAVASRLPMGTPQPCPLLTRAGVYRVALAVPITVQGKTVNVTAVHLATAATGESLSLHGGGLPAYLRRTTEARAEQIARLNAFQQTLSKPQVICGDFNTPPRGRMYHNLLGGRSSAWSVAGQGAGWTFSSKHPLLRIDHIFTSPDVHPLTCDVPATTSADSDHRPVVADLALTAL